MDRSFLTILTVLLVVVPATAATVDRGSVDEVLMDPARAVHAALYEVGDADRDARVQDALDSGAYRWALTIAAESVAEQRTDTIWSASRSQQDPYAAYATGLHGWITETLQELTAVAQGLSQAEQNAEPTTREAEWLLFAAQYAVMAESSLSLGGRLIATAAENPDSHDTPSKRHILGYPLAQAVVFTAMAEAILDDFSLSTRGNLVYTSVLETIIEEQGGAGEQWLLPEAGILHRLARHLSIYELDLLRHDATAADVEAARTKLADQHLPGLLERGFSGARADAVALDAAWWLERGVQGEAPSSESHGDILNRMRASLELAQYEADLLSSVTPTAQPAGDWSGWPWVGLGAVLAGLALVAVVLVRRRSGEARQRGGMLPAFLAALLVASVLPLAPHAEAGPTPADPFPDPFLVAADGVQSWGGSVFVADDGTVHFAWAECKDAGSSCPKGRLVLRYRSLDPTTQTWSDPVTLVDVEGQDAYMPRVVEDAGGLVVVWQQGMQAWTRGNVTEHPAEVWWCRVEDDACTGAERVSEEDVGVESSVVAVGPDGRLRVAWSQLSPLGIGEVVFRQRTASGWGPLLRFADGGPDQWQPALAVDGSDTAHVAWLARHADIPGQAYRVVYHATVEPGAAAPSASRDASQHLVVNQGAALAARGDTVHLAYGTEQGLYHRALTDGEWTEAFLVSPTGVTGEDGEPLKRPVLRPDLAPTADGVAAVWLESVHPHHGKRLRMAELNDGLWLRPETVLVPPHHALFNPDLDVDALNRVHLTWAGAASPEDPVGKQRYLTVALGAAAGDVPEPEVTVVSPPEDGWVRSDVVELAARVGLGAPLDEEGTRWLVDGAQVAFDAAGDRFTASLTGLDAGLHDVRLTVEDTAGNRVVTEWRFGVDRTPPAFTSSVRGVDGAPAEGWSASPVRVVAQAVADDGAPVVLEAQAVDGDGAAVALSPGNLWTVVPADGLELPADVLLEVTVRARDEAGNVALSEPVVVGWDGSSPALDVAEPPAWYAGVVDLDVALEDEAGAPVTVEATLAGDGVDRTALLGSGALSFDAVPDGRYSLAVLARDAAGNEASAGPWQVGVDATRPTLEVQLDGGQAGLVARDAGSGLSSLRVLGDDGGALVERSLEGDAETSVSLEAGTQATVVVTDVAGNELRKALRAGALEDVEEDLDDVAERGPDGRSWLTPGPGPVLLLVALGVLAGCLRRQEQ